MSPAALAPAVVSMAALRFLSCWRVLVLVSTKESVRRIRSVLVQRKKEQEGCVEKGES